MKFKCVRMSCESCPHKKLCDDSPYYGDEISDDYIFVYWANKYDEGAELINAPITMDGKCVGVITRVSKEYIYGELYVRAVAEFNPDNNKCVGFGIVGGSNGRIYIKTT